MKVTKLNKTHETQLNELGQLTNKSKLSPWELIRAVALIAKFTVYNYECERQRKDNERRRREMKRYY